MFYPMLKELSKRYHVYSIDMLGMGLSSRPKFECKTTEETIEFFVESLEKFRIAVGIEQFYLGGHSFGGYMACNYAAKYPSRIKKLFLISPVGMSRPEDMHKLEDYTAGMNFFKRQMFQFYLKFWTNKWSLTKIMQKISWLFAYLLKRFVTSRFDLSKDVSNTNILKKCSSFLKVAS